MKLVIIVVLVAIILAPTDAQNRIPRRGCAHRPDFFPGFGSFGVKNVFDTKDYALEVKHVEPGRFIMKLVGVNGKTFKGFLMTVTPGNKMSPVGFYLDCTNGEIIDCTAPGSRDGVTHNNNDDKESVQGDWVGPFYGGNFVIRVSVVEDSKTKHFFTKSIRVPVRKHGFEHADGHGHTIKI